MHLHILQSYNIVFYERYGYYDFTPSSTRPIQLSQYYPVVVSPPSAAFDPLQLMIWEEELAATYTYGWVLLLFLLYAYLASQ